MILYLLLTFKILGIHVNILFCYAITILIQNLFTILCPNLPRIEESRKYWQYESLSDSGSFDPPQGGCSQPVQKFEL